MNETARLAEVAAQMGHASIQTTATTYAHVTPVGQKRAADLLPSLVQFGAVWCSCGDGFGTEAVTDSVSKQPRPVLLCTRA